MKTRKFLSLLTALVLAGSLLAGCGGGETSEDTGALTEEEYQAAFLQLGEDFEAIQNSAANVDVTDPEAALQLLEDCKAPLEEFMALVPPAAYEQAHAKLSSGSQNMIDALDIAKDLVSAPDPDAIAEASSAMTEHLTTAATEMAEGAALLEEAAG